MTRKLGDHSSGQNIAHLRRDLTRAKRRQRGPKGSQIYEQAHRDVMLALRPMLQTLRQSGRQASRQTRQINQRTQDVYGALGSQLSALDQPYQDTMAGISSGLSQDISGLAPLLQQSVGQAPQTETAAGAGVLGAIGAGGLSQLASQAATGASYNTSAQRQGVEESAIAQRNALSDLGQYRGDLRTQRADLMRQAGPQTLQRMDSLRQQQLDRRLALANLAMQQGTYGMQQQAFQTDQASQAAQQAIWNKLMSDPDILKLLFGG